jgi:hypothetical protein
LLLADFGFMPDALTPLMNDKKLLIDPPVFSDLLACDVSGWYRFIVNYLQLVYLPLGEITFEQLEVALPAFLVRNAFVDLDKPFRV